jgi:hypothetical protein
MSMPQMPAEKPGMFTGLAIATLISGILNILYGLTLTGAVVIGTIGIGLLCAPVTILPSILGIFEILYAVKLLANPPQSVQPSQAIAIMEICCILLGGVIPAGVGIFALVAYSDASVKQYFTRINGQYV